MDLLHWVSCMIQLLSTPVGTIPFLIPVAVSAMLYIYPTKKKPNSKIFPLSFSFNAKMLIVIKYLVLIKSHQNSSVA